MKPGAVSAGRYFATNCAVMKWLRVCANCSSSLGPVDLFCESCWGLMADKAFPAPQQPYGNLGPFPVHYLWEWRGQESLVGGLIYSLKNSQLPEAQLRLINYWLQAFEFLGRTNKSTVIVFPTKNLAVKDHAFYLAEALGHVLGISVHPIVIMKNSRDYRLLGRKDRYRERRMIRDLKIEGKAVLFIDDVFTTGATAVRAWQSLGEPTEFRVCVLAYKGFRLDLS